MIFFAPNIYPLKQKLLLKIVLLWKHFSLLELRFPLTKTTADIYVPTYHLVSFRIFLNGMRKLHLFSCVISYVCFLINWCKCIKNGCSTSMKITLFSRKIHLVRERRKLSHSAGNGKIHFYGIKKRLWKEEESFSVRGKRNSWKTERGNSTIKSGSCFLWGFTSDEEVPQTPPSLLVPLLSPFVRARLWSIDRIGGKLFANPNLSKIIWLQPPITCWSGSIRSLLRSNDFHFVFDL